MKTITNIFNIHPLTYVLIIISLLSGRFKNIIIFMSLIIIHELGHFLTAKLFNYKVDKIYLYPLGGITKFKDSINKPFMEDLLIAIMGPVFQIIFTMIFKRNETIVIYSSTLLVFNLLPIVPLDGGRILELLLSLFTSYRKSLHIIIHLSYLFYILLIIFVIKIKVTYFFLFVLFLLILKIKEENSKINYYYNKYLIERLLYNYRFHKSIIINNIRNMYKYRYNFIKENNQVFTEKEYCERIMKEAKNNCK